LKGLIKKTIKSPAPAKNKLQPTIIPRDEHTISRKMIHPNALKVLYRLHQAGYEAYLVGGCVRDLLLGRKPKDFDVATNARPEEIRGLFKNCRLIGKRFRLAHILFGRDIIEVATFRTHHENANEDHGKTHQGMIIRDNVYGSLEDDVMRRDFSINALYYNIADFSLVDYTQGMQDIKHNVLRMIGDPAKRFHEDPVRLIRAVRFSAKLNSCITPEMEEHLIKSSYLLQHVSPARLFQEILKFFQEGAALKTVELLRKYHLFEHLFPQTGALLHKMEYQNLIHFALENTDQRIKENKPISPAFLFSALLWPPLWEAFLLFEQQHLPAYPAFEKAIQSVLSAQCKQLAITRQLQISVREICLLQYRFTHRRGKQPYRLILHPRFRAAYDLMQLRAQAGEPIEELAHWWSQFYESTHEQREKMLRTVKQSSLHKKQRTKKSYPHKEKS